MYDLLDLFKKALGESAEIAAISKDITFTLSSASREETVDYELENGVSLHVAYSHFSNFKAKAVIDGYSCNITTYLKASKRIYETNTKEDIIRSWGTGRAREEKIFDLSKAIIDALYTMVPVLDTYASPIEDTFKIIKKDSRDTLGIGYGDQTFMLKRYSVSPSALSYLVPASERGSRNTTTLRELRVDGNILIAEALKRLGTFTANVYNREDYDFEIVDVNKDTDFSAIADADEDIYIYGYSQMGRGNGRVLLCNKETSDFFAEKFEHKPVYVKCRMTGLYFNIEDSMYRNFSIGAINSYIPYTMHGIVKMLVKNALLPLLAYNLVDLQNAHCRRCGMAMSIATNRDLHNKIKDMFNLDIVEEVSDLHFVEDTHTVGVHRYCESCVEDMEREKNKYISAGIENYRMDEFTYNGKTYHTEGEGINDYDYEPYMVFYGDDDDLHLGVEIELDKGGESDQAAEIVSALLGSDTYAMSDGSLNDGFELATMPATLDYHLTSINYEDAFKVASALGYRAHDTSTCGIHVHFDKSFFGTTRQTQELKATYLTYIMEHNWEKFKQFARRDYSDLRQWAAKKDLMQDVYADDSDLKIVEKWKNKYAGDKYVALNTCHSKTYELRIFRGTLKVKTYKAILQFVDNLVRLSKSITSIGKAQQVSFKDIVDFNQWDELTEYCNEKGLI